MNNFVIYLTRREKEQGERERGGGEGEGSGEEPATERRDGATYASLNVGRESRLCADPGSRSLVLIIATRVRRSRLRLPGESRPVARQRARAQGSSDPALQGERRAQRSGEPGAPCGREVGNARGRGEHRLSPRS
jgi:hypothetical protein